MSISEMIKGIFQSKEQKSRKATRELAERINNRPVRYVTERQGNVDEVVGRQGHINILPNGEELAVTSGIKEIFRARIDEMCIWELLSKDGVALEGFDLSTGRERKIIAYYVYYR